MAKTDMKADQRYTTYRILVFVLSYSSLLVQGIIGLVALVEGVKVQSAGVLGFGIQTINDMSTTVVVLWRFHGSGGEFSAKKEKKSVLVLAILLVVLSLGVAIEAIYDLVEEATPSQEALLMTICGIGFCFYTMFACLKMFLGEKMKSKAVFLDGLSTVASASLGGSLMFSIIVYKVSNLWYMDNIIAIIFAICMISYAASVIYTDIYKPYKMQSKYTELPGEIKMEINGNVVEERQIIYV